MNTPQEQLQADVTHATDDTLQEELEKCFAEGVESVEIQHPTEGSRIVTREEFERLKLEIRRTSKRNISKESPAERIRMAARHRRQRQRQLNKFIEQMKSADKRPIDPEQGEMGFDINGDPIDMESRTFLPAGQYPVGIDKIPHELGCLVDESLELPPIRLVEA